MVLAHRRHGIGEAHGTCDMRHGEGGTLPGAVSCLLPLLGHATDCRTRGSLWQAQAALFAMTVTPSDIAWGFKPGIHSGCSCKLARYAASHDNEKKIPPKLRRSITDSKMKRVALDPKSMSLNNLADKDLNTAYAAQDTTGLKLRLYYNIHTVNCLR